MKFPALCVAAFAICALPVVHATSISSENFDESNAAFHTIGNGFAAPCGSLESDRCVDMNATGGNSDDIAQTSAFSPNPDFNLASSDGTFPNAMVDEDPTFTGGDSHSPNDNDPPANDPPSSAADPAPEPSTFALAGFVLLAGGVLLRRARRV